MRKVAFLAVALAAAVSLSSCADLRRDKVGVASGVVDDAVYTVNRFKKLPELSTFRKYIDDAKAVVVLPTVIKAGFIGGGEGGNGVLLVRGADGAWSEPAFYTLGAASIGLQAGIQDTEVILVIRSADALQAILEHQGKLGADAGMTMGVVGVGMEAATTTNMGADVLAFANAVLGAYGGASFEGAVLARRNDLNEAFYGVGAQPKTILFQRTYSNAKADALRAALAAK